MQSTIENNTKVVVQENTVLETLITSLKTTAIAQNIILVLNNAVSISDINNALFMEIYTAYKTQKKSFIIVSETINFNETPETMVIVPSLQEAHDMVEMEEIERDLGF